MKVIHFISFFLTRLTCLFAHPILLLSILDPNDDVFIIYLWMTRLSPFQSTVHPDELKQTWHRGSIMIQWYPVSWRAEARAENQIDAPPLPKYVGIWQRGTLKIKQMLKAERASQGITKAITFKPPAAKKHINPTLMTHLSVCILFALTQNSHIVVYGLHTHTHTHT